MLSSYDVICAGRETFFMYEITSETKSTRRENSISLSFCSYLQSMKSAI